MQETAERRPNCKVYQRSKAITLLNSLLSAMSEEATFKLSVLQSHLKLVWAVLLPFHLLSAHLLGVVSDSSFPWQEPCKNLACSWCQSYNGRSKHTFGPRNSLGREFIFQIKKLKQKPILTWKLVSGEAEQQLCRGAAGRQNDIHMHGDLGMGYSCGCKCTNACSPTNCTPYMGEFFAFIAWPCPFTLCTC